MYNGKEHGALENVSGSSNNEDSLHSRNSVCKQDSIKSTAEQVNSFMQVHRCILSKHDYQQEATMYIPTCTRVHLSQTLRRLEIMPPATTIKVKDREEAA